MRSTSSVAAWIVLAAWAVTARGAEAPASQDDILAKLEAYAKTAQQQWNVPGFAIAVVKDDQVVYAKGFGVKRVGGTDPVDPDTVFQIGSTSKAFTAALVAMQVDDGKFAWTDRVIDHLPSFEMHDPWVTREFQVADLMAQHSGMPAYAGDGMAILGYPADYIVSKIKLIEPVTSFRSEFAYVNNLFLVAADLARATSGQPWASALDARLFRPLGMRSSSSGQDAFEAVANAAAPHKLVDGKVTAFAADAPQLAWAYTYGPAGGINSTVRDMAQWLRLLLGGGTFAGKRIVGADNLRAVMSPHTVIRSPSSGPLAHTPFVRFQNFYCNGWISTDGEPAHARLAQRRQQLHARRDRSDRRCADRHRHPHQPGRARRSPRPCSGGTSTWSAAIRRPTGAPCSTMGGPRCRRRRAPRSPVPSRMRPLPRLSPAIPARSGTRCTATSRSRPTASSYG